MRCSAISGQRSIRGAGSYRLLRRLWPGKPPLPYPAWLGYAPATLTFLAA